MFCDGYINTFISAFNTALAFIGGMTSNPYLPVMGSHVPKYMERANVDFLRKAMKFPMEEREIKEYLYDETNFASGDFLAILRLDGIDPLIMYATGSHAGHTAMTLWFEDELYVIESQDAGHWPKQGIQRNKYRDWIRFAKNADYHVTHMPLSKEARENFNEKAA